MPAISYGTFVSYHRGTRNSSRTIEAGELYRKFNGLPAKTRPWALDCSTSLHSINLPTGVVLYHAISSVRRVEASKLVDLHTADGHSARLSGHSRILTTSGFQRLDALGTSDTLLIRGSMKARGGNGRRAVARSERCTVEGLKFYSSGWLKCTRDPTTGVAYWYRRQHRARLVLEAELNGMRYEEYVETLRSDPRGLLLKTIPRHLTVHHVNEITSDDRVANLQIVSTAGHAAAHNWDERRFRVEYTRTLHIEALVPVRRDILYVFTMREPFRSFGLANGIFVEGA